MPLYTDMSTLTVGLVIAPMGDTGPSSGNRSNHARQRGIIAEWAHVVPFH